MNYRERGVATTTNSQLLRLAGPPPSGWEHRVPANIQAFQLTGRGDVVRTRSHYEALLNDKLKSEFNLVFTSSSALCKCPTQNGIHILPDGYKYVTRILYKLLRNNTKPWQQLYSNGHIHPSNLCLPIHSKHIHYLSIVIFLSTGRQKMLTVGGCYASKQKISAGRLVLGWQKQNMLERNVVLRIFPQSKASMKGHNRILKYKCR